MGIWDWQTTVLSGHFQSCVYVTPGQLDSDIIRIVKFDDDSRQRRPQTTPILGGRMKRCINHNAVFARQQTYRREQRQQISRELEMLRAALVTLGQVGDLSIMLKTSDHH